MLARQDIKDSRKRIQKILKSLQSVCEMHEMFADVSRLKLLYLFHIHKELCPSDLSGILSLSMSAISHQLKVLEDKGFLSKVKVGKMICYSITPEGKNLFQKWCNL